MSLDLAGRMPFKRARELEVWKFSDQTKLVPSLAICWFRSIVGRSARRASVYCLPRDRAAVQVVLLVLG